jgi:putative membrane protein
VTVTVPIARNTSMAAIETLPRDRGTVLAEERTDLAIDRTLLAAERTLMAWIRTALSMIGFGFTIFKFFQYLPEEIASGNIQRPQAPRNLALTLIGLAFFVAIAVILIGVITFYGVLLRHGPF